MKILMYLVNAWAWVQIAASPSLVGLMLGFMAYIWLPDSRGLYLGAFLLLLGIGLGIYWAVRISRKMPPTEFLGRLNATRAEEEDAAGI